MKEELKKFTQCQLISLFSYISIKCGASVLKQFI